MLSANNHVISASHESEKYKKFVWDYEGKKHFGNSKKVHLEEINVVKP